MRMLPVFGEARKRGRRKKGRVGKNERERTFKKMIEKDERETGEKGHV